MVCACAALALANSRWAAAYDHVLATTIAIDGAGHVLSLSVHQWISGALTAVFFLLVGLEIKREALVGELASPRQAALPIIAAVGGMLVPALIYFVASGGGVEVRGWAIPPLLHDSLADHGHRRRRRSSRRSMSNRKSSNCLNGSLFWRDLERC